MTFNFFLHKSFSYGQIWLHPNFHRTRPSGIALKVCVGVGWGGGVNQTNNHCQSSLSWVECWSIYLIPHCIYWQVFQLIHRNKFSCPRKLRWIVLCDIALCAWYKSLQRVPCSTRSDSAHHHSIQMFPIFHDCFFCRGGRGWVESRGIGGQKHCCIVYDDIFWFLKCVLKVLKKRNTVTLKMQKKCNTSTTFHFHTNSSLW